MTELEFQRLKDEAIAAAELAHLHEPSSDPKQQQIDYWGRRAEKAEALNAVMLAALQAYAAWADPVECHEPDLRIIREQIRAAIAKAAGASTASAPIVGAGT